MRLETCNDDEATIKANMNIEGDYAKAYAVARRMIELADMRCINLDIAAVDEWEGWVQLCGVWNNAQRHELKECYKEAKAAV